MNVFISWRGSDRDLKDEVVMALRNSLTEDTVVWESDEGCKTGFSQDCIEAVDRSHVFVLIVSDETMKPSYVLNELNEAKKREMKGELNIVVFKITDAEYTPGLAGYINHLSDVNHVARLRGEAPDINSLVRKVAYLLDKRKHGDPEKPYEVFTPVLDAVPVSFGGYFVDHSRDGIFEQIDEAFKNSNIVFLNQVSGYGRKSAAREYARLHRNEYTQILTFHQFAGSLKDFLAVGVVIKNLNSKAFESLSDNDIIRKKAEYLSKLSSDTLLIVPHVKISDEDNEFIFDALGQIGCRVAFVTESIPSQVSDVFPAIDVGRMEDNYLDDLFFHYYQKADVFQRVSIVDTLNELFLKIKGHTKSVEIIAKTLNEDPEINQDNIIETLADIGTENENSLSDSIFSVLASIFDMQNMPYEEEKIFLLASLLCQIPMDTNVFIEFLRENGYYSREAFSGLAQKGWIEVDNSASVVSVDPFVVKMCLSKIKPDSNDVCCIAAFFEDRVSKISLVSGSYVILFKRITPAAQALGCLSLAKLSFLAEKSLYDVMPQSVSEKELLHLKNAAADEFSELCPLADESMDLVIGVLYSVIKGQCLCEEAAENGYNINEIFKIYINEIADEESDFDSIFQILDIEELAPVKDLIGNLIDTFRSGNVKQMYTCIFNTRSALEKLEDEDGDELKEYIASLMARLCVFIINAAHLNDYFKLKLLRAGLPLVAMAGRELESSQVADFYYVYFISLYYAHEYGEEMDRVYDYLYRYVSSRKKDIFETNESRDDFFSGLSLKYIDAKISNSEPQKADNAYKQYVAVTELNTESCEEILTQAGVISNAYIKAGEPLLCAEFIKSALDGRISDFCEANATLDPLLYDFYEILKKQGEILTHGVSELEFEDGAIEYRNYYDTYLGENNSRILSAAYRRIADEAEEYDFSDFSDGEIAAKTAELRKKAAAGRKWNKLAPEAFALVNEAGKRILGYPYHYVQYIGGAAMADGKIAEMRNGEGKTYTIVLTAYLKALYGKRVRIVDSSKYLTERNYSWMHGIYDILGLKTCLLSGDKKRSWDDDIAQAESCDVIYETTKHLALSYMYYELGDHCVKPVFSSLIADEADDLLISNALQTFALSSGIESYDYTPILNIIWNTVTNSEIIEEMYIENDGKYTVGEKFVDYVLKEINREIGTSPEDYAPFDIASYVYRNGANALQIFFEYENGRDYHIVGGRVMREEKLYGNLVEFSSVWDYFIRRKEHLPITRNVSTEKFDDSVTLIEILMMFDEICGATATASSLKKDIGKIYGLDIISIPPNKKPDCAEYPPVVFVDKKSKLDRIINLTNEKHEAGQPVLIITGSIPDAEQIGKRLSKMNIPNSVISGKNSDTGICELICAGEPGKVTVGTAIVNRGVDILLGGNPYEMTAGMLRDAGVSADDISRAVYGNNSDGKYKELYDKYNSLLALNKSKTNAAKKLVEARGGLCVIGTECFDDLRTEQQVRGRQGRQGAPGESYIMYSLDDDALKELFGKKYDSAVNIYKMLDVTEVEGKTLNNAITTGRVRLQHSRLKSILDSYAVKYNSAARKKLNELIENCISGKTGIRSIVYDYFASNSATLDIVKKYMKDGTLPPEHRQYRGLCSHIKQRCETAQEKEYPQIITDGYFEYMAGRNLNENDISKIFAVRMPDSFGDYLSMFSKSSESLEDASYYDSKKAALLNKYVTIQSWHPAGT